MKIRQNLHIHSAHSCDSACATLNDIQKEMTDLGMSEFGISDHLHTQYNLCDIQGLSYPQIAKLINISEGTLRSRLHYAHRQLQGLLADEQRHEGMSKALRGMVKIDSAERICDIVEELAKN